MRIWMEEQAGERDHFAAKITLAFAGLVAPAPTFLGAPPQAPAYFLA